MSRRDGILVVVLWVVSIMGAALVAYQLKGTTVTVVHGTATVGIGQAAGFADGNVYNIPVDNGVWQDANGNWEEGGQPTCLPNERQNLPVTFGTVPVTAPNGQSWDEVIWVSCAG
jgi:hypothetical protein